MPIARFHRLLHAALAAALLLALLPAPAQALACVGSTYTVKLGDSMASIAKLCKVPYAALLGINVEISNPDLIFPGQVIRLKAGVPLYNNPATGPAQEGGLQENGEYIARPGDSLARIAYLYNTSVASLLRVNPDIRLDRVIYPGQHIRMPDDARKEKGWVGVSTLIAVRNQTIEVRVVDFPAYAAIDINLGELDIDNSVIVEEIYEGRTDAKGQARINIKFPAIAWSGEEWIVEVVATEQAPATRAISPVITID